MSRTRRFVGTLSLVVLLSGLGLLGTFAAFTATTTNAGNQITSGTVVVNQHAGYATLYSPTDQKPGQSTTGCVRVTYTGSLGAKVRLYSTSTITNGSLYNLKVERGSGLTTLNGTMSCAGFSPDGTNPTAYDGALGSFPATYAPGLPGKDDSAAWATNNTKDYRFTITQNDDTTANAHTSATSSSAHTFTWEARNYSDYAEAVLRTSGLISYWRLGESSGTNANDETASNNDGTYTLGPTLGAGGALVRDANTAATFDGVDDYVDAGNSASLQLTTGSVEAWVKIPPAAIGAYRGIVMKSPAYGVMLFSGGDLGIWDFGAGAGRTTSRVIADDIWHHVAVTFQSGVASGTVIYLDGRAVTTTTMSVSNQTGSLLIGASYTNSQRIPGTIDEAAVYNRVLSAGEVSEHFDAGR